MKVEPSSVRDVELIGPENGEFLRAVTALLGRDPDEALQPALPYSVVVRNHRDRALALLGVRFDMVGPELKAYSVVHYADTLRNPEKSDLQSGAMRFICVEPLYTDMVLRRANSVHPRGLMNLANLRGMVQIRASIDCAAFDDGSFFGPDKRGAFQRFALENIAEERLVEEVLRPDCAVLSLLEAAIEIPAEGTTDRALLARRTLAKRLAEGVYLGGIEEARSRARNHRLRIGLHRDETAERRYMR
jgi:hypothetical protein